MATCPDTATAAPGAIRRQVIARLPCAGSHRFRLRFNHLPPEHGIDMWGVIHIQQLLEVRCQRENIARRDREWLLSIQTFPHGFRQFSQSLNQRSFHMPDLAIDDSLVPTAWGKQQRLRVIFRLARTRSINSATRQRPDGSIIVPLGPASIAPWGTPAGASPGRESPMRE